MWSTWRFGQISRCLKDVKNDDDEDDDDDANKEAAKLMRASNVPMGTGVISV